MLTPEKLLREKAIFASVVYDLFLMPVFNWVALKVGSLTRSTAIPHDIAALNFVAVGLSFLNVCANLAPLPPLHKVLKTATSVLVLTQFRTKVAKSIGSAIATACVAIKQLSTDPDTLLWVDRAGILIVTIVTLNAAYELMKSAIPDLAGTPPGQDQSASGQAL